MKRQTKQIQQLNYKTKCGRNNLILIGEKMTAKEYFEMATGNTIITRPQISAEECIMLMTDYANRDSNQVQAGVKPACEICQDEKIIHYQISQDESETINCPKCNNGNQKAYERLKRMIDNYNIDD